MIIRDLQEHDMEGLAALYRQFWDEPSQVETMKEQFARLHGREGYIFLAAQGEERLLGSVMGIVCQSLYGDCRPYLLVEDMVVDRDCRRMGVGQALLSALEDRARAKGCVQSILVTELGRKEACAFYESMGYPPTGKGYKKKL